MPVAKAATSTASGASEDAALVSEWEQVLKKDPKAPAAVADILGMVGLPKVKRSVINQYHRIRLAQVQGDGAASSYNVRFDGNPGTGKTTVARHYSTFLQQLEVLPKGSVFVETSGASLIHKGVTYLEEELDKAKKAGWRGYFSWTRRTSSCPTGAASRSWTSSCRWLKASAASMVPWCGSLPGTLPTWTSSLSTTWD